MISKKNFEILKKLCIFAKKNGILNQKAKYCMLKRPIHKLLTGNIIWQIVVWALLFIIIFIAFHKGFQIASSELFQYMTSYDKETKFVYAIFYIIGVAFFSGFLVMILTNGIRNKINKIERGDIRYKFNDHIVFLGYNEIVLGLLSSCPPPKWTNILFGFLHGRNAIPNFVILVEKNVAAVTDELVGVLGKRKNIYILHGSRLSAKDLNDICVKKAKEVYLIGENEPNADLTNLQSLKIISSLVGDKNNKIFFLYNNNQGKFCSWEYCNKFLPKSFLDTNFLKVIDFDELSVNNILGDPDNIWPELKLHRRNNNTDIITWESDKYVHLVILGMNEVAKKLIKASANFCHFPNHVTKGINTKITIIDDGSRDVSYITDSFASYFDKCTYEIKKISDGNISIVFQQKSRPNQNYIDIDFEFIDTRLSDTTLQKMVAEWGNDSGQILSIYACFLDFNYNFDISTSLPQIIYDNNIPIWLYARNTKGVSVLFKDKYPTIVPWGSCWELHPFGRWNRYVTSIMCNVLKYRKTDIPAHQYYQEFLNYVSFLSILHTSTHRFISGDGGSVEEIKALIKTEYYRNCATALFDNKDIINNLLILEPNAKSKTGIKNFEDLDETRHYFESLLHFGLDVFQGKKIRFNLNNK